MSHVLLRRTRLLGVIFLALLLLAVYLTYALFSKKFAEYDEVSLRTSKIGLQLPQRADIKIRGVIVGEVLGFEPDADGATVTLGIYPEHRETIPANVTGSIVPKTLFGEKYVSLVVPDQPSQQPIAVGQTIERTQVATEVEEVLSDLFPLLRTLKPAQLNMTLNAISTALEGRGERLGENLETVDSYLRRFNPELPKLVEDLRLTAEVSDTYSDILPQIGQILDDSIVTTGTLEERDQQLQALFDNVAGFSGTAEGFLAENESNLIRLGKVSRPFVDVLAKYAPEYPCLLKGIVNAGELQAEAFRNFTLHIVLETLPNQPRPYNANDVPRYGEDRGPTCLHLPNPPGSQENPLRRQPNMNDGVDEPTGKGTMRAPTGFDRSAFGYAGTTAESDMLKSLLSRVMAEDVDDVDDLGVLLVGPMARGAEVSVR